MHPALRHLLGLQTAPTSRSEALLRAYIIDDEYGSLRAWRHDAEAQECDLVVACLRAAWPWPTNRHFRELRITFGDIRDLKVVVPPAMDTRDDGELIWLPDCSLQRFDVGRTGDGQERCALEADGFMFDVSFGAMVWREVTTAFERTHEGKLR